MKKLLMCLVLCVLCSGLFAEIKDVPTVSASGKAEKEVKADAALVVLQLSAEGILVVDAEKSYQEKYAKLEGALKEVCKDLKIEQKTVAIGQRQNRSYSPDSQPKPQPEIRKQIILTLPPESKLILDIIDVAMRNGAGLSSDSQISYSGQPNSVVYYVLKDCAQVEKNVQEMAFADFKKNAEELAALAGRKTGKLMGISTSGSFYQQPYMMQNVLSPYKYYSVEPDKIKVSASIFGSFELKD